MFHSPCDDTINCKQVTNLSRIFLSVETRDIFAVAIFHEKIQNNLNHLFSPRLEFFNQLELQNLQCFCFLISPVNTDWKLMELYFLNTDAQFMFGVEHELE